MSALYWKCMAAKALRIYIFQTQYYYTFSEPIFLSSEYILLHFLKTPLSLLYFSNNDSVLTIIKLFM